MAFNLVWRHLYTYLHTVYLLLPPTNTTHVKQFIRDIIFTPRSFVTIIPINYRSSYIHTLSNNINPSVYYICFCAYRASTQCEFHIAKDTTTYVSKLTSFCDRTVAQKNEIFCDFLRTELSGAPVVLYMCSSSRNQTKRLSFATIQLFIYPHAR